MAFLVAQRLLKMQVSRLRSIKSALIEKLNNHPLSTANTAVFGSDQNQGNPPAGYNSMAYFGSAPANADNSSQSGGMMGNNSQSANRSGQTNPSCWSDGLIQIDPTLSAMANTRVR